MKRRFVAWLIAVLALACLTVYEARHAHGRDNGQWEQVDPAVRNWYDTREITDATQKRLGVQWKSCCKHADVVRSQFRVNKADGEDEWFYMTDAGAWKRIPPDIIHWDEHAPDGQPTLFVDSTRGELCFFPPDGGI